ncbi:4-(cytidine 5'-diphospho)-2-C-methyl-D-erythritol kinase [Rhizobium sp. KVB221]|uniref:4-diphosphocytidyl-2-C-methyl-D-erythritol kinase n=1 Tax=Rhizobium setariae TaxID=2801340 RepID=A0A936YR08_9HYPH|nr:4-(cytidine 5'-diphospho)-2-C-methyl-D-erythritol kinase [Rhizobium setariae]MBL0370770.1 4-(cytidine 5'-diphospho)-2-C-methyl-D-erythritol kinase [Rhizobium setariae]
MTIHEFAPAKINLALHVTGQRPDGYHLLDTLVTFADAGDRLRFAVAERDAFTVSGRFASGLPTNSEAQTGNLVLRARDSLRAFAGRQGRATNPVEIHLEKNLPIASGIGGGSADAAATLRGLLRLWDLSISPTELADLALTLGADVPMCLEGRPLVARGIGEEIQIIDGFPKLHLLLFNPMVAVSTPVIFKLLATKDNSALLLPPHSASECDWIDALRDARNDLQPPAERLQAVIAEAIALLSETKPVLARMSGSGASCFGIYEDEVSCRAALAALEARRPEWYLEATTTR